MKEIKSGSEARKAIQRGINKATDAVRPTLGAIGKTVMIDNGGFRPTQTDDGVTVLKSLTFSDKYENMGAHLIKEIAVKTKEVAGDGTTTASILGQSIINNAFRIIGNDSSKVERVKQEILKSGEHVINLIKDNTREISNEDIEHIATISSLESEVGKIISDVIKEVGRDGTITVESSSKIGLSSEVVKGIKISSGYVSPYMAENDVCELNNPVIWIADRRITTNQHISGILQKVVESGKTDILIIAEDIDKEALSTLVLNKMKGTFKVAAVRAPFLGTRRTDLLQDIATLTQATLISEDIGLRLEDTDISHLGTCEKVVVNKESTVIIGGMGDVQERVAHIKKQVENESSLEDKKMLHSRVASLTGGIGVIRVGTFTESEQSTRISKIQDAVNATKAAMEEGVVPGGGVTLCKIAVQIERGVVSEALAEPFKQMARNAGYSEKWWDNEIKRMVETFNTSDYGWGYDFKNRVFCDLLARGVMDPAKVTRLAISNAVSMALSVITTEAAIISIE